MHDNLFSNKMSNLFNDGVLSQLKRDGLDFKIATHLDHLPNPLDAHVVDHFDRFGNYLGSDFGK